MRFKEVDLDVERCLRPHAVQECLDGSPDVPRTSGPRALSVQVLETQAVNVLGHVLQPEQVRLVAILGEPCGDVPFPRIQIPVEAFVSETHNAVAVRVAASSQTGPTRAALGSGAERTVEPGTFCRQPVEVGRSHALNAVAAKMVPEVVAGDDKDVRFAGIHSVRYNLLHSNKTYGEVGD